VEHSFIGCLTPSVVNAPNTTKRGLALIPFTPSLKGLVVAMFVGLAGCGGGDPEDIAREHIPQPVGCNVQPRPIQCL
jgi:hypothetical protein